MSKKPTIEEELEVELEEVELPELDYESKGNTEEDLPDDYKFLREKLWVTVERGSLVLDYAVKGVVRDPNPISIGAVSNAMKAINESSRELLALHEKIRKIKSEKAEDNNELKSAFSLSEIISALDNKK